MEHRPIAIIFDEDEGTIKLQEVGRARSMTNVSISMTSMSGGESDAMK